MLGTKHGLGHYCRGTCAHLGIQPSIQCPALSPTPPHLLCRQSPLRPIHACEAASRLARSPASQTRLRRRRRHLSCVFGMLVGLVAALVYLSVLVLMRPFVVMNLVTPTWEEVNRYRIDGTLLSCPCTGQSLRINSLLRSPSCTKGSVPP